MWRNWTTEINVLFDVIPIYWDESESGQDDV